MPRTRTEVTLRFIASALDINIHGKVHGGAVMKWMDEAAYACAAAWCGRPCVTVYVDGIRFVKPVQVGSLVEVAAKLIHTGRTSMHMALTVRAGAPQTQLLDETTHSIIVFVALDDEGRPTPVPTWTPETPEEIALERYAVEMMELRKRERPG